MLIMALNMAPSYRIIYIIVFIYFFSTTLMRDLVYICMVCIYMYGVYMYGVYIHVWCVYIVCGYIYMV